MKETLVVRKKNLNMFGGVAKVFDNHAIEGVKDRIELLLAPVEKNGVITSRFEQYFRLDFEETEPLIWAFIYPHPQTIFGLAGVFGQMRKHGLNTDAQDRWVFRDLVKQAGLESELESLEVSLTEREI
jgi:hypothetical protein